MGPLLSRRPRIGSAPCGAVDRTRFSVRGQLARVGEWRRCAVGQISPQDGMRDIPDVPWGRLIDYLIQCRVSKSEPLRMIAEHPGSARAGGFGYGGTLCAG